MKNLAKLIPVALMLLLTGVIPCSFAQDTPTVPADTNAKSLYERLGGKSAITAVVDTFVANVAADKRINARFANTDIPHLKLELVGQICAGTGGPCTYTGKDMKTEHQSMAITDADFNALVEDLVAALDSFKVPEKEKTELLDILGSMRKDIVTA